MNKIDIDLVNVRNLSQRDKEDISEILTRSDNATIFHSLEWNEISSKEFHTDSSVIIARSDETPLGFYLLSRTKKYGILNVFKSPNPLFEAVYGGPIATKGFEYAIRHLIEESEKMIMGAVLSIQAPPGYDIKPFSEMGYSISTFQTSILDLQREEGDLWRGIDRKARNLVRKAEKSNLVVSEGDECHLDDYYELIKEVSSRSGNPHLLPESFYRRVIRELKPKGLATMCVIEHDQRVIAGAIFLCYKGMVYYWNGASSYEHRTMAPNNLIQWDIIRWARDRGYKYYDLVRIEPNRLPGIAKFKEGWGGKTTGFYYAFKITGIFKEIYKLKSKLGENKRL